MSERKIVDYIVESDCDIDLLIIEVRKKIILGYCPMGGICVTPVIVEDDYSNDMQVSWYHQAMVKYEET